MYVTSALRTHLDYLIQKIKDAGTDCYPIPKVYDVDYTIGIGPTRWFEYGGDRGT